jgi:hypothetical protein
MMMITDKNTDTIAALDLDPIKFKLMHEEGWSLQEANAVEVEYRRFLYLMKMFPNEDTAPLVDVDTFWHYHILDTVKYAADCDHIFGYFLHHFPYVGMRGKEDEEALERMGERMRTLYEETFGESYVRTASPGAEAATDACASSTTSAKPAYCGVAIAGSAYCDVPTVVSAYAGVAAANTAYCGVPPAKPAYCGVGDAKPAYFGVPQAKRAYCGVTRAKPAYCGVTRENAAYCGVTRAQPAYCGVPAANATNSPGSSQLDPAQEQKLVPEKRAGFYSERPVLAAA